MNSSTFIAISALMASIAMTRSVYATKVSDEAKMKRELHTERLNVYADTVNFIILGENQAKKVTQPDIDYMLKVYAQSKYIFERDSVSKYIDTLLITVDSMNSNKKYLNPDLTYGSEKLITTVQEQDRLVKKFNNLCSSINSVFDPYLR